MTLYRVLEVQTVHYTWDVDSEDYDTEEELQNALNAIDGVPDHARSRLVHTETIHMAVPEEEGTT